MTDEEHIAAVNAAAHTVAQAEAALRPVYAALRLAVEAAERDGLIAKVLRHDQSHWAAYAELVPLAPPRFLRKRFPPGSTTPEWQEVIA